EAREIAQEIERAELHHGSQLLRYLPHIADLREMLEQGLDCEAALHLELRVETRLGFLDDVDGNIGREDLDGPACDLPLDALQQHGDRIRLLPARCRSAPDSELL